MAICRVGSTIALLLLGFEGAAGERPHPHRAPASRTELREVTRSIASSVLELGREPVVDTANGDTLTKIQSAVDTAKGNIDTKFTAVNAGITQVTDQVDKMKATAIEAGETADKVDKQIQLEQEAMVALHGSLNTVDTEKKKLAFEVVKWLADNEKQRVAPLTAGTVDVHTGPMQTTLELDKFVDGVKAQQDAWTKLIEDVKVRPGDVTVPAVPVS